MLAFTIRSDEWVIHAVFRHTDQLSGGGVEAFDDEVGLVSRCIFQVDEQIIALPRQGDVLGGYSLITFCEDVFTSSNGFYSDDLAAGGAYLFGLADLDAIYDGYSDGIAAHGMSSHARVPVALAITGCLPGEVSGTGGKLAEGANSSFLFSGPIRDLSQKGRP
ncbi:hypothetical protein [Metapseudomonas otitidis]|uniref:Uncharacterized protein n=1 Tax=Metapseudomonas otitidis TaxID=319939 RepID=A0A679GT37_9GAMM|nr:hypothetical protein [Pseudomonas otitidis]BCA31498.1 hypothetical protein PtoMrB4_54750 [Pseudomonas otitidis]